MTIAHALQTIRQMGLSASYKAEYKEYRVTIKTTNRAGAEAIAYYTNDAQDAIDTAKHMVMSQ